MQDAMQGQPRPRRVDDEISQNMTYEVWVLTLTSDITSNMSCALFTKQYNSLPPDLVNFKTARCRFKEIQLLWNLMGPYAAKGLSDLKGIELF